MTHTALVWEKWFSVGSYVYNNYSRTQSRYEVHCQGGVISVEKMKGNLWFSNSWKEEDCLHCSELIAVHLQLIFTGLDIVNMDSCDCFLHDWHLPVSQKISFSGHCLQSKQQAASPSYWIQNDSPHCIKTVESEHNTMNVIKWSGFYGISNR